MRYFACLCLTVVFAVGCGSGAEAPYVEPAADGPPAVDDPSMSYDDAMTGAGSGTVAPEAGSESPAEEPAEPSGEAGAVDAAPDSGDTSAVTERVEATVGVGAKGRSLDEFDSGVEGSIATPAKAYFSVRERAVFEIQIPQALRLFKATNGNGPKSHDEFMAQIVEANQIALPELNAGQRYVYEPATEQLMVERPR